VIQAATHFRDKDTTKTPSHLWIFTIPLTAGKTNTFSLTFHYSNHKYQSIKSLLASVIMALVSKLVPQWGVEAACVLWWARVVGSMYVGYPMFQEGR
jgi:hypothetical protein